MRGSKMPTFRSTTFAIAFTVLVCATAGADFMPTVTVDISPVSGDLTRYVYTVTNNPESDLYVDSFYIDLAPEADLSNIMGPQEWDITYSSGDRQIVWSTSDLLNYYPIPPGSTETFSFESSLQPEIRYFLVNGIDFDLVNSSTAQGAILAPSINSVPEPGSLTLCFTGVLLIALLGSKQVKSYRA